MIDPANAVHHLLNRTLDRAVAATPAAIDRCIRSSVNRGARAFLKMRPMEQQTSLFNLLGLVQRAAIPNLEERLQNAITAENQRGRSGHWAFDANRILALRQHNLARRYDRRFWA